MAPQMPSLFYLTPAHLRRRRRRTRKPSSLCNFAINILGGEGGGAKAAGRLLPAPYQAGRRSFLSTDSHLDQVDTGELKLICAVQCFSDIETLSGNGKSVAITDCHIIG